MDSTVGHSIWLMPEGLVYDKLQNMIFRLGKSQSSPIFPPHITLLGDILESKEEMLAKAKQLASLVKPQEIKFTDIDYRDQYFRAFFLKIKETPELTKANVEARKLFKRENDPKFLPHLSLMYGNFSENVKVRIKLSIKFDFDLFFQVKSIHVVSCDGVPKDWYAIKEFPLV